MGHLEESESPPQLLLRKVQRHPRLKWTRPNSATSRRSRAAVPVGAAQTTGEDIDGDDDDDDGDGGDDDDDDDDQVYAVDDGADDDDDADDSVRGLY